MAGPPANPRSAHRQLGVELIRLIDRWTDEGAASQEALTRAALWSVFQSATGPAVCVTLPAEVEISPAFGEAVGELVRRQQRKRGEAASSMGDVLGYVFERSLARKELGAYFTAPDVAAYICRSTLLPRLLTLTEAPLELDRLAGAEGIARYIPAVRLQSARLPTEAAYEQRLRQSRLADLLAAWKAGAINSADDCLTWNLDLCRIALDSIEQAPHDGAVHRWEEVLRGFKVLDPTCGAGDFLLAAHQLLAALWRACDRRLGRCHAAPGTDHLRNLCGTDLLPGAVEVTRMRLFLRDMQGRPAVHRDFDAARLCSADFLCTAPRAPLPSRERFDAIIGNPPYVSCARERDRYEALGYQTAASGNRYALVMERSLGLLAEGGRLGMIVPVSSVSGAEFRPLVRLLTTGRAWVSTYSNRPAKLFEGVEQRLAIWLVAPGSERRLNVSAYQHWWREERPSLFDRLQYHRSSAHPANGLPLKTGGRLAERIYQRLMSQKGKLADLSEPGTGAVWLHDGPTYWVRALPFEPNADRAQRSRHYHRLPARDDRSARILAAVLSSTTFYLFYKWTSNCRDLGTKDWSSFPLDPLPEALAERLADCGERLGQRLRSTATSRTRVYPRGEVRYEEYHPAGAKDLLDQIDRALAEQYGFTDEELEYILSYDLKYRIGRSGEETDEH